MCPYDMGKYIDWQGNIVFCLGHTAIRGMEVEQLHGCVQVDTGELRDHAFAWVWLGKTSFHHIFMADHHRGAHHNKDQQEHLLSSKERDIGQVLTKVDRF